MKKLFTFILAVFSAVASFAQMERSVLTTEAFHKIDAHGAFEIYIRQGSQYEVIVAGPHDDIRKASASVSNGVLNLEVEGGHVIWNDDDELRFYITYVDLNSIELGGAVELEGKNRLDGSSLSIDLGGAASLSLDIDVSSFEFDAGGASEAELSGRARTAIIETSGASELSAENLVIGRLGLMTSGASEADVNVTEKLKVDASGASDVRYKGNPEIESDISTASSFSKY